MKGQLRLIGGRKLESPKGSTTRPTQARVREAVISLLGNKVIGSDWLDLFSGSGVMGCEALQRGAQSVLAIERDKKIARVCESNLLLSASDQNNEQSAKVICADVIVFLKSEYKQELLQVRKDVRFDLVYIDPPYKSRIYYSVLEKLLEGDWLKPNSLVICEHASSIILETPNPWIEKDRRVYGSTALLLISPPLNHSVDTDSRPKQTAPK